MKQIDVLTALQTMIEAALPGATVRGFGGDDATPETIGNAGAATGYPGDPGEPDICLSPRSYTYDHEIEIDVAAAGTETGAPLTGMLTAIGLAVTADRHLGGLCDWLEAKAPVLRDRYDTGLTPNWATVPIIATYTTSDPLA